MAFGTNWLVVLTSQVDRMLEDQKKADPISHSNQSDASPSPTNYQTCREVNLSPLLLFPSKHQSNPLSPQLKHNAAILISYYQ